MAWLRTRRRTAFIAKPGSQLLEATDFALPISPVAVEVLRWADGFQEAFGSPIVIDSIQLGSLQVEEGVKAKVVLKGEKDVRAACKELIRDRRHVLEKLQCRVVRGHLRASVLLANNASVKVDGHDLREDVVLALRAALPKSG